MNSSSDRAEYLLHHLVALRDSYALSSLLSHGDTSQINALADDYLRDATVLMSAAYGRVCADQVRASAPRRSVRAGAPQGAGRPAAGTGWVARAWRRLVDSAVEALRRHAQEWHHQTLAMAGRW